MEVSVQAVLHRLAADGLCSAEQIGELSQRFGHEADCRPMANWLVNAGVLTTYQTAVLLGRRAGPVRVGDYVVLEPATQNRLQGMLRARHRSLGFPALLKRLEPHGDHQSLQSRLARFQREARIGTQVGHPHVVRAFQAGECDDAYYLAIEDLRGQSLQDLLSLNGRELLRRSPLWDEARGKTRPGEVCRLMRETAFGLAHLHEQQIVHRDVTPRNLWVTTDWRAKVMGLGAARDALSHLDSPRADQAADDGDAVDASLYHAPEQLASLAAASPRSDLYGLGCAMYHALTGRTPFNTLPPHVQKPYAPSRLNDAVPKELDAILARLLSPAPSERYPSAHMVARLLEPFVSQAAVDAENADATPEQREFLAWLTHRSTDGQAA